ALSKVTQVGKGELAAPAAALPSFGEQAKHVVERLRSDLAAKAITVDDPLEALRDVRTERTGNLEAFSESQIAALPKSTSEADAMRDEMQRFRRGSVRAGGSILDLTYGYSYFWHVTDFHAGYRAGTQSVERSRASSSSSGVSSGYGGGTSFSGSGGSSRF